MSHMLDPHSLQQRVQDAQRRYDETRGAPLRERRTDRIGPRFDDADRAMAELQALARRVRRAERGEAT